MMVTCHGAWGSGSRPGSGTSTEPIDKRLSEFIASEVTRGILNATPMMFGLIKEGIIELMEDCLRIFTADLAASQSGARSLSFKDFKGCRAPYFFGVKNPIAARR